MKYKILIVEDDEIIAGSLKRQLENWDFAVGLIDDFKMVMTEFAAFDPDLVILDISLPYYNGYKWCSDIRQVSEVPIVFLSSVSDNMNIVMAMNMGADDFINKPFNFQVLVAKIQALLRRTYDYQVSNDYLEYKGAMLDIAANVLYFEDLKCELTKNEMRIMKVMLENKNKVVSRELLMQRLWENDYYVDDNTLSVNMTRIRKKLELIRAPFVIRTKKGQGYLLD